MTNPFNLASRDFEPAYLALYRNGELVHRSEAALAELAQRLLELEARLGGGAAAAAPAAPARSTESAAAPAPPRAAPQGSPRTSAPPPAAPAASAPAGGIWESFLAALRGRSMRLWGTLNATTFAGTDTDGALLVQPGSGAGLLAQVLRDPETEELFRELLNGLGVKKPQVRIAGASKPAPAKAPEAKAAAAPPAEAKPAKAEAKPAPPEEKPAPEEPPAQAEKDTRTMGQLFKDEPMLQKALDMFDGEVLP